MPRPEIMREQGRGPLGSDGTASSPDNKRIPKNTPGTLAVNDAHDWTGGRITFEDFAPAKEKDIKATIKFALRKIAEARKEAISAKSKPSKRVGRFFKIITTTESDKKMLDIVINNFNLIASPLLAHENLVIDGEETGPIFGLGKLFGFDVPAYIWRNGIPDPGEEGVVKIVKPAFNIESIEQKARILIHEVCHKYTGLGDKWYVDKGAGRKVTPADAIRNTDTYAHFAIPKPRSGSLSVKR